MREPFDGAVAGFFAARHLRLLHLVVPPHVFGQTLAYVRAMGSAGGTRCAVHVLAAPSFGPSRGWPARALALDPGATATGADPLHAFAETVRGLIQRTEAKTEIVLVLAPQHIADAAEQLRDVEALVRRADLAGVRWIVVDAGHSSLGDLAHRLAPFAAHVAWVEMDKREQALLEHRIASLHLRASAEPTVSDVELDAKLAIGRASTLFESGAADAAEQLLASTIDAAERRESSAILVEAYGLLGNAHVRRGRFADAATAFSRAATNAEKNGERARAAELLRCAGHAALNSNQPDDASRSWSRAFELLDGTPPVTFSLDPPRRIVVLAIGLADLFDERGNPTAARGLREHAEAIEQRRARVATSFD